MAKPMTLDECKRVLARYEPCMPAVLVTALRELVQIAEHQANQLSALAHQAAVDVLVVSTHHCAARGCTTEIPHHLAMCWVHWRSVPRDLQKLIVLLHRHRQQSPEYRTALQDAVEAVARVEANKVTL